MTIALQIAALMSRAAAKERALNAFAAWSGLAAGTAGVLLLGAVAAQASDATALAGRAGFLVGHAYRCGVADARLKRSVALVDALIVAFAADAGDQAAAQAEFAAGVLAGAPAIKSDNPLPSCAAIRAELVRLQQHRPRTALRSEAPMARNKRSAAAATPAASAKPVTTRREDMTAERRAALELKRAARRLRGRPPSI